MSNAARLVHYLRSFEAGIVDVADIQTLYESFRACDREIPGLTLHTGKKCSLCQQLPFFCETEQAMSEHFYAMHRDKLDQLSHADALKSFSDAHPVQRLFNHRADLCYGVTGSSAVAEVEDEMVHDSSTTSPSRSPSLSANNHMDNTAILNQLDTILCDARNAVSSTDATHDLDWFFSHQRWDRIVQQVDQQDPGLIRAMTHANAQHHQAVNLACMRYFSSPQDAHSALYIPAQDFYVLRHVLKEKLGPDLQTEGLALFQNDKTTVEYARVCTRVMLAVCVLAEAATLPSCILLPPTVKQSALALLHHAKDRQLSPERDHFDERSLLPFPTATDDYLPCDRPSRFVLEIVMILSLMSRATFGVKVADVPPICSKLKYMCHVITLVSIAKDCRRSVISVDDVIERHCPFVRDGNHTVFTSICQASRLATTAVYSTPQMPSINWVPFSDHSALTINSTEVSVDDLRTAVAALVSMCKRKLSQDLLLSSVDPSVAASFGHGQVNGVSDDASSAGIGRGRGYSYLNDPANGFGDHQQLVLRVFLENPLIKSRITQPDGSWNKVFVKEWFDHAFALFKMLFTLMHLSYGQPARVEEIASLKYANTVVNGTTFSPRNLFWMNNTLMLATSYHKSRANQHKDKFIA
ncbi:hypothetical protein DM01DRAFT_358147, partial [Hesseltinella vesiculosa]